METATPLEYGFCPLAIIPLRADPDDRSEMISQVLFGEFFTVLGKKDNWLFVQLATDTYKGWIDKKQSENVSENIYNDFIVAPKLYITNLIQKTAVPKASYNLPMGAVFYQKDEKLFSGQTVFSLQLEVTLYNFEEYLFSKVVKQFINTPYLWGGKSLFGIDCSGFTQVVFSLFGVSLFRDAKLQATQGELVPFFEQTRLGDLAFFENKQGSIVHVGIILSANTIIHAHGKVRIDKINQEGIYNEEQQKYTHKLRFIKRYF